MEMKSNFVQLYVDASTWSMVAILGFERIRIKGKIVRFVTRIRRKSRRNFRDQKTDMHKELCTILVN